MATFDWSRFTVRINVNDSTENIYSSWATRKGIESWFLRLSEYKDKAGNVLAPEVPVIKGNTYRWLWYGWPDDMEERGEILDSNGKDYMKFQFGKAGDCAIKIKQEEGETIVELVQDNIPTDEEGMKNFHLGCKTGWTFYLANLKSVLEGGLDLRNRNEAIKRVINS